MSGSDQTFGRHRLFDGTEIDLGSIRKIEVAVTHGLFDLQHSPVDALRFGFDVHFEGREAPDSFRFSADDLLGAGETAAEMRIQKDRLGEHYDRARIRIEAVTIIVPKADRVLWEQVEALTGAWRAFKDSTKGDAE